MSTTMSYIVPGKCRQCGCRSYKESLEGDNCYSCGHVRDLHLLQYMPKKEPSSTTSAPGNSSIADMTEATVDLSQMKGLKEVHPESAPGICFEETVAAAASAAATVSSKRSPEKVTGSSKGLHQASLESVFRSQKMSQPLKSGESKEVASTAKRMAQALPDTPNKKTHLQRTGLFDSPNTKSNQTPVKVTPKKKRTADIFESPVPGNGEKPACWRLMMSHLPYGMEPPDGVKGAYKIAENGQTIYVGNATKVAIEKLLREKFKGKDKQIVGAYLSTLSEEDREKHITLYWIDESEVEHTCGCTYLKCFIRMEGKKPKYNMAGVRSGKTCSEQESQPPSLDNQLSDKSMD